MTVHRSAAVSRRSLLQAGAVAGGGFLLGVGLFEGIAQAATSDEIATTGSKLNAFIRILPDDSVTMIMPAVEMGQGAYTSMAMMLAEELDIGLADVVVEHAPPDQKDYGNPALGEQITGGSTTTLAWFLPLRKAGARARFMLVGAAARQWGVEPATLRTEGGTVFHDASGRSTTYGKLADHAASIVPPSEPTLKDPHAYRLIGRSLRRLDTPDKVIGKTVYGIDVRLPGMKIATLASAPILGGTVAHVDQRAALVVPGVRQVVVLDDMVAVVGDHMWAAKKGLEALEIDWNPGPNAALGQNDLWAMLDTASRGPGVTAKSVGDADGHLVGDDVFETDFELPYLAHAALEPLNCTVHVTPGACEIWVGTQVMGKAQTAAAEAAGLDPSQVVVHNHMIGGGFGRRLEVDCVTNAVRIARHVDGPLKVIWTREEDIRQDRFRPLYHMRTRAKVERGRITAWHHRITGPSILARWLPGAFQKGIDADAVDAAVDMPYDFANVQVEFVRHETPVVPTAFWRGVGPNANVFAAECMIDKIAHHHGLDPVAFRRAMIQTKPRARAVLDLAAARSGWGSPLKAPPEGGRVGRGVALLAAFGSFLATVAEVCVADDGSVQVLRVVTAVDVGQIVNPNTLQAQVQGGTVFGLAAVLHGEITVEQGRIQQTNFNDYRVTRIDEMPILEVHFVQNDEAPGGIGEPGTVTVQPAIVNAVFAATGVQLTRMPIDAKKIARGAA